jgi:hypothetical protein
MKTLTKYTVIKRTLLTLQNCYPCQKIDKQTIINCLNNTNFQDKYIKY